MDPLSILGIVGVTLKTVKELCDGLRWMQRIYESVTNGDKTLQSIALECNIYGDSIKAIGQWLKINKDATGLKRQMRTTHNAITLLQVSLRSLLLDLRKTQESADKPSVKDQNISKEKYYFKLFQQFLINTAKQQWFSQTMRMHLVDLRAHAATLHLTLGVIKLTEHTPEHKEKTPGKLADKTGQLEKRLLLRQFIKKALEVKRAEAVELTKLDQLESVPLKPAITSSPNKIQDLPQKLTFYDVVQLARQQALAEKTRQSSEDLIDFSDTPRPLLCQAPSSSVQSDVDLLNTDNFLDLQEIDILPASSNEFDISKSTQILQETATQPASSELNMFRSQEPCDTNLLEPDELQISRASNFESYQGSEPWASVPTSNPPNFSLHEMSSVPGEECDTVKTLHSLETINSEIYHVDGSHTPKASEPLASAASTNGSRSSFHRPSAVLIELESHNETPTTLELATPKRLPAIDSNTQETNEFSTFLTGPTQPSFPIHQAHTVIIGQENHINEICNMVSSASTATPSIFSHTSSLSSTTGAAVPGITEEDLHARNTLSNSSANFSKLVPVPFSPLAERTALGPTTPSSSQNLARGSDAEMYSSSSIRSTSTIHVDLELPFKHQRTRSVDTNSQSPLAPLIPNIDEPDSQGFPWIVRAARDGNEELIRKLLVSGADIKASHATTQRHALSEASIQGHQRIVDLLINEECRLNYTDAEGNTALHHACQKGYLTIAKSLIINNAPIDASGPQGKTALHLAMQIPHQNVVMLLIQHKANVNARDDSYQTPLHIGASQGNVAMCSYLINEGAHLDSREAQSKTPIQIACEAGHYELVQMMLDQSNLNPTNVTFLAAFFAAVESGHVRIAESFFSRGLKLPELKKDFYKPISLAAKSGVLAMVELMIQEDCDVNAKDINGWNALHFASDHGHYQVIDRLIATGVFTATMTSRKETPLLLAVKGGHFSAAERLLRSTRDTSLIHLEDERCQQLVHHVARIGSVEIFNLLMSNGAKINAENSFGWQPLHISTAYGHLALVQRLLEQGAKIEEKLGSSSIKKDQTHKMVEDGCWAEARWPYPGSRSLHLACEYGHYQIACHLISRGAKLEATCSEGWQPLHHATYIGSSKLVEMLLGSGVYPHATTNEGKTALDLPFCTSGLPISAEEKEHIRKLLKEAMNKTKKQKTFKVALKRGNTVEEKHKLVRAATLSIDFVSRPHTHTAMTITPFLDRPSMPRSSHTSPLSLPTVHSASSLPRPLTPPNSASQLETKPLSPEMAADPTLQKINEPATEAPEVNSVTDKLPPPTDINTPDSSSAPDTEMQVSVQSPKNKSKSNLGLNKVKPGIGIGNVGLGIIGKQMIEIGKQASDIRRQGIEKGKQRIEKGKQGLDKGKQKLENAKKSAKVKWRSGKSNPEKQNHKSKSSDGPISTVENGDIKPDATNDADNRIDNKHDRNDADGSDHDEVESMLNDSGSVFSIDEFVDGANDDTEA